MLTRTFIHSPGIGLATERKLWEGGFETWEACLRTPESLPLGPSTRSMLLSTLEESTDALQRRDAGYFARQLPMREHWRAARDFPGAAYLDIETDGGTTITVIGVYDGRRVRQYVRGDNLQQFPEEIAGFEYLVTFFGTGFDVPMLRRTFPNLELPALHLDLCHALRKLGYRGGLKAIEGMFGLRRSAKTTGLSGWDAVRLWQEYRRGRDQSLALLLAYNAEDIVHLEPLLNLAYEGLAAQLVGAGRSPGLG